MIYSIKERKSILENKKAHNKFQFSLTFGPKIKTDIKNENTLKSPPCQVQLEYKFSDEYQYLSYQDK